MHAAVRQAGTPPLWGRRPGFATLVRIVLEQQVSLASGAAAYARLQSVTGRVTPRRVLAAGPARLRRGGITRQKTRYCLEIAARALDGRLDLAHVARLDDDAVREKLVDLPGVGRWTADIYLLMALGRPDVWPVGDLALARSARTVKRLRAEPSQDALRRMAAAWAPWRSVAARVLWHHYLAVRRRVC